MPVNKTKREMFAKGFFASILLIAIMIISLYIFTVQVDRLTSQNIEERLSEVAQSNVQAVALTFGKDIQDLTVIAKYWEDNIDLASEQSLEFLHDVGNTSAYVRLALDLPDGTSYTSDGLRVDVSGMGYLNEVLAGNSLVTDAYVSTIENEVMFGVAVPVYRNGAVVAALRGVYRQDSLESLINTRTFAGHGYINIVSSSGDFLIKSSWDSQGSSTSNIFTILEAATFDAPYSLELLRKNIAGQTSDFTTYNINGVDRCAYYTPLGFGGWYVFSSVSMEYLMLQKNQIDLAAIVLLTVVCCLFIALIIYIGYQNYRVRSLLLRERDYFERVLNNIPLPVFITTADRNLTFINEAAFSLFQCGPEMLGRPCCEFNTCICNTFMCAIETMETTGSCHTFYEMNGKSYQVSTAILSDGTTLEGKYIEVIQDITEIVNVQRILEEKTLELETINENLSGGLLITYLGDWSKVVRCNQGYLSLLGCSEQQLMTLGPDHWIPTDDLRVLDVSINEQLEQGDEVSCQHRIIREDGKRLWVSLHGKRTMLNDELVCVWMITDITNLREAEMELQVGEERYRLAMENTEDIIIDYNLESRTMFHSDKAREIYGVPVLVENVPDSLLESGTVLPESAEEYLEIFQKVRAGATKCSCEIQARASDGSITWNRLTFTTIFDNDGHPIRAVGILQDISREREAQLQYKRESRYRELSGSNALFYYEADLTCHRFVSGHERIVQAFCEQPTDDFDTIIMLLINNMVFEPDRPLVQSHIEWEPLMHNYEAGVTLTSFEYRRIDIGTPSWVECAMRIFFDEESSTLRAIGCVKDINEAKTRELTFQQNAERDLLTGLYNKVTSQHMIQSFINSCGDDVICAFMLIDLDNFKSINDTMGHAFGDLVLTDISHRLMEMFEPPNIVGRLGGDEFVVFVPQADDGKMIAHMAQQICNMFHNAYVGDEYYKISGSIGVAMFPQNGSSFEDLYKNADNALYSAKGMGKDVFCFYSCEMSMTKRSPHYNSRAHYNKEITGDEK